MANNEYVTLDTRSFDAFIESKDSLIKQYDELNTEYDRIVSALLANWKGRGAAAFAKDAKTVKTNIVGIYDILKILCDTLTDCRSIFEECDAGLGDYNRNPEAEQ